ncbi:MAG: helix-turn-helix transcriptional regulator, partial [Tunicatimonas sp.]
SLPIPTLMVVVERFPALPTPALLRSAFNLTRREVEVTQLLVQGLTDREVAKELFISVHTARRHSENVLRKLGISSRAGIAHHCWQIKG